MNQTAVHTVALKEWASAIEALRTGRQLLLLRKGGIDEETKDFRLQSRTFYLYPTYEHQKKELLKDEYKPLLEETLKEWSPGKKTVTVSVYAEAVEDLEIDSQEQLDKLRRFHIWTDRFAEERLRWKRTKPLHVLVLRVYELKRPIELPVVSDYLGCKSWVELQVDQGPREIVPVLEDAEFSAIRNEIQKILSF